MKDIKNIEDYNIWACTDYTDNQSGFTRGSSNITLTSSHEWSVNGESCLKIERTGDSTPTVDTTHLTNVTENKTIQYSVTILTKDVDVIVRVRGKGSYLTSVTVPSSPNAQIVSLSAIIPSDYEYVCLRFAPQGYGFCHVDDITCTVT